VNGKTKKRRARRSKASLQGGGVAGCVYAKTAAPPAVAALAIALYKLRAKPDQRGKISGNQRAKPAEWGAARP